MEKIRTWLDDAECKDHPNPNLFWYNYPRPDDKDGREETILQVYVALGYCETCPVRKECLAEGLKPDNLHAGSIWGGMLFVQRRRLAGKKVAPRNYKEDWLMRGLESMRKRRSEGV